MPPLDATPRALAIQTAIHRAQSADTKFRTAMEMSDFTHELVKAALRKERPELTETELQCALIERLYGERRRPV
jgi:hypothetical protein